MRPSLPTFPATIPSVYDMLIHSLKDTDGSRCTLTWEEGEQWLRATWSGFVDIGEAIRGAEKYLAHAGLFRCAYLLNNNLALEGPWFDSLEWLEQAWLPHARRLGLRYVAHVVQADTGMDVLTQSPDKLFVSGLNLQLFSGVAEAEEWLRSCQQRHRLVQPVQLARR